MYKYYQRSLISLLFLLGLFSQAAMGVMITQGPYINEEVGDIDVFIEEDEKLNGEAAETEWVNGILGGAGVTLDAKAETVAFYETDETGVIAFLLQSSPGYYLIKNAQRTALFENNSELGWGVIDLEDVSSDLKLSTDDMYISHVTEFNGGPTTVPEPSTLALLGVGLIGLFLSKRRHSFHTA